MECKLINHEVMFEIDTHKLFEICFSDAPFATHISNLLSIDGPDG